MALACRSDYEEQTFMQNQICFSRSSAFHSSTKPSRKAPAGPDSVPRQLGLRSCMHL
jgi:hypothetical protein